MGPDFENPLEINFVFSDAAMSQFNIEWLKAHGGVSEYCFSMKIHNFITLPMSFIRHVMCEKHWLALHNVRWSVILF